MKCGVNLLKLELKIQDHATGMGLENILARKRLEREWEASNMVKMGEVDGVLRELLKTISNFYSNKSNVSAGVVVGDTIPRTMGNGVFLIEEMGYCQKGCSLI
ncbi:unnamed protein product [Sphenostylis stenocarpa]|uniref:Uncharacterized protein n=1 Tax=Sphenostylis stenocarpa TaxID=92480 RepID=A0AA86V971_9FABA|nr:unnamed protein product [Sphenostylis stenocarpa]